MDDTTYILGAFDTPSLCIPKKGVNLRERLRHVLTLIQLRPVPLIENLTQKLLDKLASSHNLFKTYKQRQINDWHDTFSEPGMLGLRNRFDCDFPSYLNYLYDENNPYKYYYKKLPYYSKRIPEQVYLDTFKSISIRDASVMLLSKPAPGYSNIYSIGCTEQMCFRAYAYRNKLNALNIIKNIYEYEYCEPFIIRERQ